MLGNVSEACRQRKMTRTQFYDYKRRIDLHSIEGLPRFTKPIRRPPCPKWSSGSSPGAVCGCRPGGVSVSSPTIQSILIKPQMGSKFERLLKLEDQVAREPVELSAEQLAAREDHPDPVESARPGELWCPDTFLVGVFLAPCDCPLRR